MAENYQGLTPPPELVQQWLEDSPEDDEFAISNHIATQAARWGADQELEACCEYIGGKGKWFAYSQHRLAELRAVRRPKPPSLTEEALQALERMDQPRWMRSDEDQRTIRRALERLQELEEGND